jgi:hypothetical protein
MGKVFGREKNRQSRKRMIFSQKDDQQRSPFLRLELELLIYRSCFNADVIFDFAK